jgi:putative tryptophan/tyrosine transport system substrate-binding protein
MTRRALGLLITLVLSFSWSWLTAAAPPGQMPRVGMLASGSPPAAPDWKARSPFLQELRTLGWVDGQNLVLEYRWAEGQPHRVPPLVAELVRLPVDVIVAGDPPAIRAVTHATTAVPIVMVSVEDPLEWGAVATLARPGGNVTGVGGLVVESSSKLLELLTEAVPGVARMAIVPGGAPRTIQDMEHAAQRIGVHTSLLPLWYPEQFEPAFQEMIRQGAGALIILPGVSTQRLSRIAALALQYRLPAIHWSEHFADAGGLMAYGPSWPHLWRRAAAQVDKILKGAKPADLPIEQPTAFELVINLKTAQALGLTMPPTLLFQATRLIR